MFPLGLVLFPGAALPLQVFEPRYISMLEHIEATDGRFGVVLIEKGSEVGGGDLRMDVGTVAEVVRKGTAEDGRILIAAIGRERIRVADWLDDDPYPRAQVEPFPEPDPGPQVQEAVDRVMATRRRLLAFAIEMGAEGQTLDLDLPEDLRQACWALCDAAPAGAFDRQRLLEIESTEARLASLDTILAGRLDDLRGLLGKQ
jgi:Lon protease-like protein